MGPFIFCGCVERAALVPSVLADDKTTCICRHFAEFEIAKRKYNLTRNIRDNAMQQICVRHTTQLSNLHERCDKIRPRFNRFLCRLLTRHTVFPAPGAAFDKCEGQLRFEAASTPVHRRTPQMNRLILAVVLSLPSTLLAQTFSYAPINVPGAVATEARGINNNGEIVGFYKTAACMDYDIRVPSCPTKGFKYVNGTYIKLMVPNSVSTAIMGVNDLGDLVGFYKKSDGSTHGFIWFHTNVVKTIDYPHPPTATNTIPFGINKAGTVVGGLWSLNSNGTFPAGGWVWVNGTFSNMNPFDKNSAGPCCWSVTGIANSGVIVGQVFQADNIQAFFKAGTDEDFFMNAGRDTYATGVNSGTDVVGFSAGGWFAKTIESNEGTNDSTEKTPSFITVKYPNSNVTFPFGLNNLRGVVGAYTDSTGKQHGFLAKPNF
jgi:hypothetical protein